MATVKAVKTTALTILKKNWAKACTAAMLPICVVIVLVMGWQLLFVPFGAFGASIITLVIFIAVLMPLWFGCVRYFWRMANSAEDSVDEAFYYFSGFRAYFRAFSFNVRLMLRVLFRGLLTFLPSIVVLLFTSNESFEFIGVSMPQFLFNLRYLIYVFAPVAILYMTYYVLKLYLVSFLFVSDETMKPKECIKRGIAIGKYTRLIFFGHIWGFVGWVALSLLAVTLIFTLPYLLMAYIVECRYNVAYYNLSGKSNAQAPIHEV